MGISLEDIYKIDDGPDDLDTYVRNVDGLITALNRTEKLRSMVRSQLADDLPEDEQALFQEVRVTLSKAYRLQLRRALAFIEESLGEAEEKENGEGEGSE